MSIDRITEEVRALERLDLEGLRAEWVRRGYGVAPKLRSTDLLRRLIAWRIQVHAHGGLAAETRRRLRSDGASAPRASTELTPGARLSREWRGVVHEVVVTEHGFVHAGRIYGSLSQAASAIAGSRWNGPRFFGLRKDAAA